jgi:hypothetical protein
MRLEVRVFPGRIVKRFILSGSRKNEPFFIRRREVLLWPLFGPFGGKFEEQEIRDPNCIFGRAVIDAVYAQALV